MNEDKHSHPRDLVHNDFDYECAYALNSAPGYFSTWEQYAEEKYLALRFETLEQLEELRLLFERGRAA
jgi:hypothetical protein